MHAYERKCVLVVIREMGTITLVYIFMFLVNVKENYQHKSVAEKCVIANE